MRLLKSPPFIAVAIALVEFLLADLRRRFRDFDGRRDFDQRRDHDFDDDNWNQKY